MTRSEYEVVDVEPTFVKHNDDGTIEEVYILPKNQRPKNSTTSFDYGDGKRRVWFNLIGGILLLLFVFICLFLVVLPVLA